jgi:hypothetical protein
MRIRVSPWLAGSSGDDQNAPLLANGSRSPGTKAGKKVATRSSLYLIRRCLPTLGDLLFLVRQQDLKSSFRSLIGSRLQFPFFSSFSALSSLLRQHGSRPGPRGPAGRGVRAPRTGLASRRRNRRFPVSKRLPQRSEPGALQEPQ